MPGTNRPTTFTPKPPEQDEVDYYSRVLAQVAKPPGWDTHLLRALNGAYWIAILAFLGWIFSMVIDREPPIRVVSRDLLTPVVRQGAQVLVRSKRQRLRQCEVTRRFSITDGIGKRHDFSPESFDAYGPLGMDEDSYGPIVPLDAAPGRARLLSVTAWDCNPLQRALGWSIVVVSPPFEFEIVPRAPAG